MAYRGVPQTLPDLWAPFRLRNFAPKAKLAGKAWKSKAKQSYPNDLSLCFDRDLSSAFDRYSFQGAPVNIKPIYSLIEGYNGKRRWYPNPSAPKFVYSSVFHSIRPAELLPPPAPRGLPHPHRITNYSCDLLSRSALTLNFVDSIVASTVRREGSARTRCFGSIQS